MRAISLGLILCLVGCGLASRSGSLDAEREQLAAIEAIVTLGGEVRYEYQRPDPATPNVFDMDAKPEDPDGFHRVVMVSLRDTEATDDDLELLTKLPYLENLGLAGTHVTSAGLAHLRNLKQLRTLSLWKTQIDDGGLAHLEGLTKMWQLVLDETDVTDAGLVHLEGMTNLEEWLGLAHTKVTDEGLEHLERLTKLRHLNLRFTQVTGDGVRSLKEQLRTTEISFRS